MRRFRIKVNMVQQGEVKKTDIIICDVMGKNLDNETILKRLTNNVKTWQSAYNKYEIVKYKFEIVNYEEVL